MIVLILMASAYLSLGAHFSTKHINRRLFIMHHCAYLLLRINDEIHAQRDKHADFILRRDVKSHRNVAS